MISPKMASWEVGRDAQVTVLEGTACLTSQSHHTAPGQLPPLRGANLVGAHVGPAGNLGNYDIHGLGSVPAPYRKSSGPARRL